MQHCMTPQPFHNFEVSQSACNHLLMNYGFFLDIINLLTLSFDHLRSNKA